MLNRTIAAYLPTFLARAAARAALARTNQGLETKAQALAALESAHAALLRDHESLGRALSDLQERHDALVRDRQFVIDQVSQALHRLRI